MVQYTGLLTVNVNYATGLKQRQWNRRQDPYCCVTLGCQTFRTKPSIHGDRSPIWNETFLFYITNHDSVAVIDIKDGSKDGMDELLGTATINLTAVRANGHDRRAFQILSRTSNKQHGEIWVSLNLAPYSAPPPTCDPEPATMATPYFLATPLPAASPVATPPAACYPPTLPPADVALVVPSSSQHSAAPPQAPAAGTCYTDPAVKYPTYAGRLGVGGAAGGNNCPPAQQGYPAVVFALQQPGGGMSWREQRRRERRQRRLYRHDHSITHVVLNPVRALVWRSKDMARSTKGDIVERVRRPFDALTAKILGPDGVRRSY